MTDKFKFVVKPAKPKEPDPAPKEIEIEIADSPTRSANLIIVGGHIIAILFNDGRAENYLGNLTKIGFQVR